MPVIKLLQGLLESLNSRGKDKEDFFDSTTKGLMVQVRAIGRKRTISASVVKTEKRFS